jgi:hypothetical protein
VFAHRRSELKFDRFAALSPSASRRSAPSILRHLYGSEDVSMDFVESICLILTSLLIPVPSVSAQKSARDLVSRTIENENLHRAAPEPFSFMSQESSTRTDGHLWVEKSVQIEQGVLRRLISVDGFLLPPA